MNPILPQSKLILVPMCYMAQKVGPMVTWTLTHHSLTLTTSILSLPFFLPIYLHHQQHHLPPLNPTMVSSNLTPIIHLTLFLVICSHIHSATIPPPPTKIGNGYKLVSLTESPDGGLVGILKVNRKNNIYGPDIPYLQLYIK